MSANLKPNTADGRLSDWHNPDLPTCGTCGGSGSEVNGKGEHVDACRACGGFGNPRPS